MRSLYLLWNREVRATFHSFGVYLLLGLVMGVTGYLFSSSFRDSGYDLAIATGASFGWQLSLTAALTPLLTMRLFAEEKRSGSIELLMTAPVSDLQVVVAKYMSSVSVFAVFLLPIWAIYAILALFFDASPDWGQLAAMSAGLFGLGLMFLAVGTMASSLTSVQLWAALLGVLGNIFLFLFGDLIRFVDPDTWADTFFRHISLLTQLEAASAGLIDMRYVVFQMSLTALVLFWTVRIVEARKWR